MCTSRVNNVLSVSIASVLMLLLLFTAAESAPIVSGPYEVAEFAQVPDPFHLAFSDDGFLYVGREISVAPDGTYAIHRVSPDGQAVEVFGPPVRDPDGVVVDNKGVFATYGPGSVLIGGAVGKITEISPDGISSSTLFSAAQSALSNPQQLAFDSQDRLLFASCALGGGGAIGVIENGVVQVFNATPVTTCLGGIAIDENDRVFVSGFGDGTVKYYDSDGTLLDPAFVSALSSPDALALDKTGYFGGDLFVVERGAGTIVRIDPTTGEHETFATGLTRPFGLTFGPDNCIYVSDNTANTIWRICALTGSITGQVVADCGTPNTPVLGVGVDVFQTGNGDLVASTVTDATGTYMIEGLLPGEYIVTIVTPLGYTTYADETPINLSGGDVAIADFNLSCVSYAADPRGIGFWKHQVGVAVGGKGRAQIDGGALCDYLDLIEAHFNNNAVNQVIVYDPPTSFCCDDKLLVAKELLNLKGSAAMIDRAKQQLMALLLNVAIGYIHLAEVISQDGATVSQAVTYSDLLIDDPEGDHEMAKTICDEINNSRQLATGMIPLSTLDIAYKRQETPVGYSLSTSYPNPFNPVTAIRFTLPVPSYTTLEVYDVLGRKVATLVSGHIDAGEHTVQWDGSEAASGIYLYRLQTAEFSNTKKMVLLK